MAIDRIGIFLKGKCPDIDLPEMEREDFPEMEFRWERKWYGVTENVGVVSMAGGA